MKWLNTPFPRNERFFSNHIVQQSLNEIYRNYDLLLPPKEEGTIIFWLFKKIENKDIDKNFTYQDIQQAIKDTATLDVNREPQTERLLKNLLHNFIERPAGKSNRYKLTEYALKFVQLVNHKINNPFRKFPLRESFQKYTEFRAEDIRSLELFESWFQQGFSYTTKQNIIDHLEALKDDVTQNIKQLNSILQIDEHDVARIVTCFNEIFKNLGAKADEIRDTLRLGVSLEQEIRKVIHSFYSEIQNCPHPQTEEEQSFYRSLKSNYNKAAAIQTDVKDFFIVVDEKLGQLRDKIVFASTKLNELHDNFRHQTKFRTNIKKLAELVLKSAVYTREGPGLPNFPRKIVPCENTRFSIVPFYDFFNPIISHNVLSVPVDKDYEDAQRKLITEELDRAHNIEKLTSSLIQELKDKKVLNFTDKFYEILEKENDVETPVQVGYDLLHFVYNSKDFQFKIDRQLPDEVAKKNILIWKMNLSQKKV